MINALLYVLLLRKEQVFLYNVLLYILIEYRYTYKVAPIICLFYPKCVFLRHEKSVYECTFRFDMHYKKTKRASSPSDEARTLLLPTRKTPRTASTAMRGVPVSKRE